MQVIDVALSLAMVHDAVRSRSYATVVMKATCQEIDSDNIIKTQLTISCSRKTA